MNTEVKIKWARALTSDEYSQGKGALRDNCSYCCLGVLCDISGMGHWNNGAYVIDNHGIHHYESFLPDEVQVWAGLTHSDPLIDIPLDSGGLTHSLSTLNDSDLTFSQIADFIVWGL